MILEIAALINTRMFKNKTHKFCGFYYLVYIS